MTAYPTLTDLLRAPPLKQRCDMPGCQSMTYHNSDRFLCVVCDHEQFELCPGECGQLAGWCNCDGERDPPEIEEDRKTTARQILEVLVEESPRRTRDFYVIDATPMYIDKVLKELWDDELIAKPKHGWWSLPT